MRKFLTFWAWNAILLLTDVHVSWLLLKSNIIDGAAGIVLGISLASILTIPHKKLGQRLGVEIPAEISLGLASALDDEIYANHPFLARTLGASPCDKRLMKQDEFGDCELQVAYTCYNYFAHRPQHPNFSAMVSCYSAFGHSAKDANLHFSQCHSKEDRSKMLGWGACARGTEVYLEQTGMCPEMAMVIPHCVERAGYLEDFMKSMEKVRAGKENFSTENDESGSI